ncbi:MAG: CBS domain-containing protein [Elusimicrobiota bacterium]
MKAREIMSSNVVTVKKEYTIKKLIKVLKENKITGAPVVEDDGSVVGIVSRANIIEAVDDMLKINLSASEIKKLRGKFNWVEGIMTSEVIHINADADIYDVFKIMSDKHIHRLPVMENKKLVGIISVTDAIKAFLKASSERNESR